MRYVRCHDLFMGAVILAIWVFVVIVFTAAAIDIATTEPA